MSSVITRLRRLWQPHNPLFWLVVLLNLLSSAMTSGLLVWQPQGLLRGVLSGLALTNMLLAWWLLARLWRGSAAESPPGSNN